MVFVIVDIYQHYNTTIKLRSSSLCNNSASFQCTVRHKVTPYSYVELLHHHNLVLLCRHYPQRCLNPHSVTPPSNEILNQINNNAINSTQTNFLSPLLFEL